MASSENLSMEGWKLKPTFGDSWISEAFARDTETLTKALQKSLSNNNNNNNNNNPYHNHHHENIVSVEEEEEAEAEAMIYPFLNVVNQSTHSLSNGSDAAAETTTIKRQNTIPVLASAKANKRKSRASKRTATTFIMADPSNFRQMVQQVTGVRLSNSHISSSVAPLLKPQPHRPPLHRFQGCLPSTLDTSAFLLDHHHHHHDSFGPTQAAMASLISGPPPPPPPPVVADGGSGFDFDTFPSFPTLESWKVM